MENGGIVIRFLVISGDLSVIKILHIGFGAVPDGSAYSNMAVGA
jgi:hypothetical protein